MRSSVKRLLATTSAVALSVAGAMATAQPALAQATGNAIYAGGSTLASQTFRQIFDCYAGRTVPGDGFTFTTVTPFVSSPPSVGFLPADCTTNTGVEGLYAGVGSGNGFRGYIADDPTQWYGGTVTTVPQTFTGVMPGSPPFPAAPPPFVDNSTGLGAYPYPEVDIGLSDAPLPPVNSASSTSTATLTTTQVSWNPAANWTATSTITASTFATATYNTTSFGPPIQVPAFEVGVAIAVNTTAPTTSSITWTINSTQGLTPGAAGSAIQLTDAQLCAIFSGDVTDWSSTQTIAYMTSGGNVPLVTTQPFFYANTNNSGASAGTGAVPYVTGGSLPIKVVFRSDGSGTSFILTNFLHNYCPLLDTGTGSGANGYSAIFGASTLPSTNFSDLVNSINAFNTNNPTLPQHSTANFVGANASGGVAATISNTAASAGFIGYVSADFTNPYATMVTGVLPGETTPTTAPAPLSASIQNENERASGLDVPGGNSTDGGNFVAPTPTSVDSAWSDGGLAVPTGPEYQLWNVYGMTYPAGTTHTNVDVGNRSVLALTNRSGAYQLSGTTYLAVYRCYTLPNRATNLVSFLTYLYGSSGTPVQDVSDIIQNNGFHELNSSWGSAVFSTYLNGGTTGIGSPGVGRSGCVSGANQ